MKPSRSSSISTLRSTIPPPVRELRTTATPARRGRGGRRGRRAQVPVADARDHEAPRPRADGRVDQLPAHPRMGIDDVDARQRARVPGREGAGRSCAGAPAGRRSGCARLTRPARPRWVLLKVPDLGRVRLRDLAREVDLVVRHHEDAPAAGVGMGGRRRPRCRGSSARRRSSPWPGASPRRGRPASGSGRRGSGNRPSPPSCPCRG